MKRTVLALVAVAALLTLVSPAMALSPTACSVLGQVSEMIGGAIDAVVANNCTTPPSNSTLTTPGGGNPTVATSEPLVLLVVGLGLLGARALRRR